MLVAAVFFSVSGIACAFVGSFEQLVVARILGGIGIGVVSIVSPLYISEVSIAQYRGRLVSLYQLAVTIGFLGAYLTNFQLLHFSQSGAVLNTGWMNLVFVSEVWRGMLGFCSLPAILFFCIIFFIPESPRWLILKGRDERAVGIFRKIYLSEVEVDTQLQDTKSVVQSETKVRLEVPASAGHLQGRADRGCHSHPGPVHGRECRALLRSHHLRGGRPVGR